MLFTRVPKISIFIQQGRLVALIHVKFGTTNGHVGPLGHTKFHAVTPIGSRGWERCPQTSKNFHFLVKSCRAWANPLTDSSVVRDFYTANYRALVFQI